MRVAVFGARGQLGGAVVHAFSGGHEVVPFDRSVVDITDGPATIAAIARVRPQVVINCAGYNDVDGAESQPVAALQANAFAVRSLARGAREVGAALVQYSTDFVFDGTASAPMSEEVAPNPRSAYAASKLLGEWFAADAPVAYVLRVESLFGVGPGGTPKGSLEAIVRKLRGGHTARVFSDRTVSPTYVIDAARATRELLERRIAPGLYHLVNSGAATWEEVAREAARLLQVEPILEPVRVADVALPAQRPQYCALANGRLAAAGIAMPTWQEALGRYLAGTVG